MNVFTYDQYLYEDEYPLSTYCPAEDHFSVPILYPSFIEERGVAQTSVYPSHDLAIPIPPERTDPFFGEVELSPEHINGIGSTCPIALEQPPKNYIDHSILQNECQRISNEVSCLDIAHQIDEAFFHFNQETPLSTYFLEDGSQEVALPALNSQSTSFTHQNPLLIPTLTQFRNQIVNSLKYCKEKNISHSTYVCPYPLCSKTFNRRQSLQLHQICHSGQKPYSCKYCEKQFARKHDMNRHMRKHTGELPYQCTFCKKSFARPDARKRHYQFGDQCVNTIEALRRVKKQKFIVL